MAAGELDLASQLHALAQQAQDGLSKHELAEQLHRLYSTCSSGVRCHAPLAEAAVKPVVESQTGNEEGAPNHTMPSPALQQVEEPANKRQKKAAREFDPSKYRQRYVALELMYVGTNLEGFARQDNTENTVEGVLFSAMRKTRLIDEQADINTLRYSRCGRTDKGVSALGQVVALMLRSSAKVTPGPRSSPSQPTASMMDEVEAPCQSAGARGQAANQEQDQEPLPALDQELDYPRLLNRTLPPEVRVLGWAPVPDTFSARFSCRWREYKYFIVDRDGSLDVQAMQKAAAMFLGPHDFRNFCKADVLAMSTFQRRIDKFDIEPWGVQMQLPLPMSSPPALNHSVQAACTLAHQATQVQQGQPIQSGSACLAVDQSMEMQADGPRLAQVETKCLTVGAVTDMAAVGASTGARRVLEDNAVRVESARPTFRGQVYALTVKGKAFLWHQVRCMAAVLLMVGQGLEQPEVVPRMLDIIATPRKPIYVMASEDPLLLYACGFDGLTFLRSKGLPGDVASHVRKMSEAQLLAAALTGAMAARLGADQLQQLCNNVPADQPQPAPSKPANGQLPSVRRVYSGVRHVALLNRPTEKSLDEKSVKHGFMWRDGWKQENVCHNTVTGLETEASADSDVDME